MAKPCQLLCWYQIGFGRSEKPLLDYSIQTYVDFLNELLRQLRVEKANLVGESLGGDRYAAEISGAWLVSFDNCGHVPSTEKTEEFLAAVNGFLSSRASATH